MARRKVVTNLAGTYEYYNHTGLTVGNFRKFTEGLPDDAPIVIGDNDDFAETTHEIKRFGNAVSLERSRQDVDIFDVFPMWLAELVRLATQDGACNETYAIATKLLMAGGTETNVIQEFVKNYGDNIKEYISANNLPKAWKEALYPGAGSEVVFLYTIEDSKYGKVVKFHFVVEGNKIDTGFNQFYDLPGIWETFEAENGVEYVFAGVQPA